MWWDGWDSEGSSWIGDVLGGGEMVDPPNPTPHPTPTYTLNKSPTQTTPIAYYHTHPNPYLHPFTTTPNLPTPPILHAPSNPSHHPKLTYSTFPTLPPPYPKATHPTKTYPPQLCTPNPTTPLSCKWQVICVQLSPGFLDLCTLQVTRTHSMFKYHGSSWWI